MSRRLAESIIIGGGIVLPLVVLGGLLWYALSIMPVQRAPGDRLTLHVTGERWWWRVAYVRDGETLDGAVVAANEVRLPRGRRTEVKLDSAEVIHSLWIPALAGKTDMFPGREKRMALEPERTGTFRGQCAEFCGTSHALMAFEAVVMEPEALDAWLERERGDAQVPEGALATRGQAVFLSEGCGVCHEVRGTAAIGGYGPDLTHVGGRLSLGAGVLPPGPAALERWIAHTGAVKPDVEMPAYDHLEPHVLEAVNGWEPEHLFWILKNGVKMSGMPYWPSSVRDDGVWSVVAFLERVDGMTGAEYAALLGAGGDVIGDEVSGDTDTGVKPGGQAPPTRRSRPVPAVTAWTARARATRTSRVSTCSTRPTSSPRLPPTVKEGATAASCGKPPRR